MKETENTTEKGNLSLNRAKNWQIALFPFNNAATNVYFAFYNYFTYFAIMYLTGSFAASVTVTVASASLTLIVSTFNSIFAPLMRVFDGITDPILGGIMDRTRTKIGKFRPFMIIGNILLAVSIIFMMLVFRGIPNSFSVLRWVCYIVSYVIYVIGYTCQCACTKAGQTCLTNDPKQRSKFVIWNMVGQIGSIVLINVIAGGILTNPAICEKGVIIYESANGMPISEIIAKLAEQGVTATAAGLGIAENSTTLYTYLCGAGYGVEFYNIMVPLVVILSAIYTIMAIAAIAPKDRPEFWGVESDPPKFKDYVQIVKQNKEIRWLVISSGFNKLASTIATSGAVAFMLYGCLMGDYNGLFLPFYALCFVFMGIFFLWGSKTAGEKGQKRGVAQFTIFALLFYVGVLILLCLYSHENPLLQLSLFSMEGGFHLTINFYTILFIILYGCGYGAFNCCDQLTIPMVADCTDYETYRSGKYLPGIMGTIFSLVDKLISSLQVLLLQIFIVFLVPGLNALPAEGTGYMEGMKLSTIICFCLLPMISWIITVICMRHYSLSGKRLQEIQAVNGVRKEAVKGGMPLEEAMETWKTIDQVPVIFVHKNALDEKVKKENILDKIYNAVFTKREKIESGYPGSNAIQIPEQYRTSEVIEAMENVEKEKVEKEEEIISE